MNQIKKILYSKLSLSVYSQHIFPTDFLLQNLSVTMTGRPLLFIFELYSKLILHLQQRSRVNKAETHRGNTKESVLAFVSHSVGYFRISTGLLLLLLLTLQFKGMVYLLYWDQIAHIINI